MIRLLPVLAACRPAVPPEATPTAADAQTSTAVLSAIGPVDVVAAIVKSTLETDGFTVELGTSGTGAAGWAPEVAGLSFTVTDPKRTIDWSPPYSGGATERIAPTVSFDMFPAGHLTSSASQMERQQPATVVCAFNGGVVLERQFAARDDGGLRLAVVTELCGSAVGKPGVAEVQGEGPPVPRDMGFTPGIFAVLWTKSDGATATSELFFPAGK